MDNDTSSSPTLDDGSNLGRYHQITSDLPAKEATELSQYLLGWVSDLVPADRWDAGIRSGLRRLVTLDPELDGLVDGMLAKLDVALVSA